MKIAMVMHKRIERKLRLSAHWECHKCNATWFMCRRFKVRDTILYAYLCNHCVYSELLFDEGVSKDEIIDATPYSMANAKFMLSTPI